MENIGSEAVNLKIKEAIKVKLTELKVYCGDDELPDYIMMLLANKKQKNQMEDDLSLFLGHNTERFTTWLHSVMDKLNSIPQLKEHKEKEKKPKESKKKEEKPNLEELKKQTESKVTEKKIAEIPKPIEEKPKSEIKKNIEPKKIILDDSKKNQIPDPTDIILKDKKKKEKKKDKKHKTDKKKKHESKAEKKQRKLKKKEAKEKERERKLLLESDRLITVGSSGKKEFNSSTMENFTITKNLKLPKITKTIINKAAKPATPQILSDDSDEEPLSPPQQTIDIQQKEELDYEPTDEEQEEEETDEEDRRIREKEREVEELKRKKKEKMKQKLTATSNKKSSRVKDIEKKVIPEEKSNTTNANTKTTLKDRLGLSSESASVHKRLGDAKSPTRTVINLREESSFPPKSPSFNSDSSNRKLEARVRPLMSSKVDDYLDDDDELEDKKERKSRIGSVVGATTLKRSYSDSEEDESYPSKSVKGIASKVEIKPRPRRKLQANTNLIMKAMADAHKSTNKSSKRYHDDEEEEEEIIPQKKKKPEIFSRSYQERGMTRFRSDSLEEKPRRTKVAVAVPHKNRELAARLKRVTDAESSNSDTEIVETEEYIDEEAMEDQVVLPNRADQSRIVVTVDGNSKFPSKDIRPELRRRLGGVVKDHHHMDDEDEFFEEVEEWEEVEDAMSSVSDTLHIPGMAAKMKLKNNGAVLPQTTPTIEKINERCRFFPACSLEDNCSYIHPKLECKTFPLCKFGDKCLYLHPLCKFDANCTNPKCPFMHTQPKVHAAVAAKSLHPPAGVLMAGSMNRPRCKFYPKCINSACPYLHPSPCKFGISCAKKSSCMFTHPDLPSFAKLKWSAKPANDHTKWTAPKLSDTKWTSPHLLKENQPVATEPASAVQDETKEVKEPIKTVESVEAPTEPIVQAPTPTEVTPSLNLEAAVLS